MNITIENTFETTILKPYIKTIMTGESPAGNNKYSAGRSFFFTEKELVNLKFVKPKKIIELSAARTIVCREAVVGNKLLLHAVI